MMIILLSYKVIPKDTVAQVIDIIVSLWHIATG